MVEHIVERSVAAQPMPALGGGFHELEDHGQGGDPGATALGPLRAQSDGGEGRFDGVRAAQRGLVLRGIGVESEQFLPMRGEARHHRNNLSLSRVGS